jgi:hypothetical protein
MTPPARAVLYLDDTPVGEVVVQRADESWSHGTFKAGAGFANFAPLFDRWARLMHADADTLTSAHGDELRDCERAMDRITARLHFQASDRWVRCAQLNIDGQMIEWKAY